MDKIIVLISEEQSYFDGEFRFRVTFSDDRFPKSILTIAQTRAEAIEYVNRLLGAENWKEYESK